MHDTLKEHRLLINQAIVKTPLKNTEQIQQLKALNKQTNKQTTILLNALTELSATIGIEI